MPPPPPSTPHVAMHTVRERIEQQEAPPTPPAVARMDTLRQLWPELAERIGHVVPFIKSYLKDSQPVELDDECVVIAFDPEFAEDIQRVDVPRNRQAIGKIVGRALGYDVLAVQFRVAAPGEWDTLAEGQPAPGAETVPDAVAPSSKRTAQHWYGDKHVQKVIDLFQGEIEDVRD